MANHPQTRTRAPRRFLIWLTALIVATLAGATLAFPAIAAGTGDDYPSYLKDAPIGTIIDPWSFYNKNCTSFAAWRLNQQAGRTTAPWAFTNNMSGPNGTAVKFGDAKDWQAAALSGGWAANSTPSVGAVAWWGTSAGTNGHVAIVTAVNPDGSANIEEYNWGYAGAFHTRTNVRAEAYLHIFDQGATDRDGDGISDAGDLCPSTPGGGVRDGCPAVAEQWSADFNGDGSADVFFAAPDGKWYVSYSGTGHWVSINSAGVNYAQLRLADLNGDGKSDVFFAAPDGKWYVSYSGTGLWTTINSAGVPYEQLRFGDFNGDGSADVFFAAPDGKWYVSYSGTGHWVSINSAGVNYAQLRLADLNGDGKSDVFFAAPDGKWYVSYSGTGLWTTINSAGVPYEQLRFGDFNGDGSADVFFAAPDGKWYVSYSGTGHWVSINSAGVNYAQLRLADLNGDGKSDVFFAAPDGKWYVSYSGTGLWTTINSAGVPFDQLSLGGGSPRRVRVSPSAPIRVDGCGTGKDTYTIPSVTGVEYLVAGTVKAAGSYPTGGITSLTITARAKTGYVLTGTTTWTLTWTTTACTTTVTGAALSTPTWTVPKATLSWTTTGAPAGTTVTYDVQYRAVTLSSTGARLYSTPTTWLTHTTAKTGTLTGTAGGVYQIQARTTDQHGTIGAWSPWKTVTMPIDDRATSFGYTGTWTTGTSTSYYGGTYKLTSTPGAKVTVTAWTDQVGVIGARSTTSGKATITIDGVVKATIDTYGATAAYRQTLATITIPYGKHTITVTNQATTGRPRLILDALAFRR